MIGVQLPTAAEHEGQVATARTLENENVRLKQLVDL